MSGRPSQTQPQWLQDNAGLWWYYRADTDRVVYQDGRSYPRPANVPRSFYLTVPPTVNTQQSNAQQQPYRSSADYTFDRQPGGNIQPQGPGNPQNGRHVHRARDPQSQVQTTVATGPGVTADNILRHHGVRITQELVASPNATEGESEDLWPDYKVRGRGFFEFGRVFHVLWAEPAGSTSRSSISGMEQALRPPDPNLVPSQFPGNLISSKTRRFVVIREGTIYCSALPITTYGGRGVAKPGVNKSEHSIIHTGKDAPPPRSNEVPTRGSQEPPMRESIRVVPDIPTQALDEMSRIDFGQVCTIHHNYKVKPFGMVHPRSLRTLKAEFGYVWRVPETVAGEVPTAESSSSAAARASQTPQSGQIGSALPATPAEMVQRARQAQSAYHRLKDEGYNHEGAVQRLITVLQQAENCSIQTAQATIYARLTYRLPSGS